MTDAKRLTLDNETLTGLCQYLWRRVQDVDERLEAVLLVLRESHPIVSEERLGEALAQVHRDAVSDFQRASAQAADDAQSAAIRALLESAGGTPS